jgi:hypothetical protein
MRYNFLLVAGLQLIWATILIFYPGAHATVPLHYLWTFLGGTSSMIVCLTVSAVIAAIAATTTFDLDLTKRALLITPQQMFISIISYGAILSIINGGYADGTLRSEFFIFADQLPIISIGVIHSVSFARKFVFHGN